MQRTRTIRGLRDLSGSDVSTSLHNSPSKVNRFVCTKINVASKVLWPPQPKGYPESDIPLANFIFVQDIADASTAALFRGRRVLEYDSFISKKLKIMFRRRDADLQSTGHIPPCGRAMRGEVSNNRYPSEIAKRAYGALQGRCDIGPSVPGHTANLAAFTQAFASACI